jgi:hypothetical protein
MPDVGGRNGVRITQNCMIIFAEGCEMQKFTEVYLWAAAGRRRQLT